jgi:hypothetical protein
MSPTGLKRSRAPDSWASFPNPLKSYILNPEINPEYPIWQMRDVSPRAKL